MLVKCSLDSRWMFGGLALGIFVFQWISLGFKLDCRWIIDFRWILIGFSVGFSDFVGFQWIFVGFSIDVRWAYRKSIENLWKRGSGANLSPKLHKCRLPHVGFPGLMPCLQSLQRMSKTRTSKIQRSPTEQSRFESRSHFTLGRRAPFENAFKHSFY